MPTGYDRIDQGLPRLFWMLVRKRDHTVSCRLILQRHSSIGRTTTRIGRATLPPGRFHHERDYYVFPKTSTSFGTVGPRMMTNIAGKMRNAIGINILIGALCA